MDQTPKKNTWGGVRTGQGRPTLGPGTKAITIKIDEPRLEKLDKHAQNKGKTRSEAIRDWIDSLHP